MDHDDFKREEADIIAEYAERYKPHPYRLVFFPPVTEKWKVEALYVDGFFEAAKILLEGIVAGTLPEVVHGVAAVFLCRHYLEIAIKYTLFHSRWLRREDENEADSEIEPVGREHKHKLQPYWDELMREVNQRTPTVLTTGLDLKFVAAFVGEFHRIDKDGWRFRYPRATIGVVSPGEPPTGTLRIDYDALFSNLRHARDVLDTLDGRLIDQHGEIAEWQSELDSM